MFDLEALRRVIADAPADDAAPAATVSGRWLKAVEAEVSACRRNMAVADVCSSILARAPSTMGTAQ